MTFKNLLTLSVAIVATLCSCKKEETPVQKGIPMTLSASISSPNSKAIATTTESGISFAWEENAKVSIITLNASDELVSNDVFSATNAAGATTASFSGTFTGNPSDHMICFYPALTESNAEGLSSSNGVLYKVHGLYGHFKLPTTNVDINSNYLGEATILSGDVSISGDELSTSLLHRTVALKIKADVSETDLVSVSKIEIVSSYWNTFFAEDWFELVFGHRKKWDSYMKLITGGNGRNYRNIEFSPIIPVNKSENFVVYIPTSIRNGEFSSGDTWTIKIIGKDASDNQVVYSAVKTFATEKTFYPGICYTIGITAAELAKEVEEL